MTVQDIANKIMQHMARYNAKPNHAFVIRQLHFGLFSEATPKEQDLIDPAIESLVENQYVTIEDRNGISLVLTPTGYEQLYPLAGNAKERLGRLIMSQFAKQRARPNHPLNLRSLSFNVIDKLNPKEQELLPDAIEHLINNGLIAQEDLNGECLILTQKGYDTLD